MNLATLALWAKDNPLATLGGMGAALVAAAFAIDDRYAHAADVQAQSRSLAGALEVNRLTSEVSVLEIRRATLRDKVYEGAARQAQARQPNAAERAIWERYAAELRDMDRQITDKQRLIDQLRTGK